MGLFIIRDMFPALKHRAMIAQSRRDFSNRLSREYVQGNR